MMYRSLLIALLLSAGVALLGRVAGIPGWSEACPIGEPCAVAQDAFPDYTLSDSLPR